MAAVSATAAAATAALLRGGLPTARVQSRAALATVARISVDGNSRGGNSAPVELAQRRRCAALGSAPVRRVHVLTSRVVYGAGDVAAHVGDGGGDGDGDGGRVLSEIVLPNAIDGAANAALAVTCQQVFERLHGGGGGGDASPLVIIDVRAAEEKAGDAQISASAHAMPFERKLGEAFKAGWFSSLSRTADTAPSEEDADAAKKHLSTALRMTAEQWQKRFDFAKPAESDEIVFYSGVHGRSALLAETAQSLGFTNVHFLLGGARLYNKLYNSGGGGSGE